MMGAVNTNTGTLSVTSPGIPIRNLWYILLYAWNEVAIKACWRAEVEKAPNLDALLATILMDLIQQRLRIGLGRNYMNESRLLRGIRGRVDFAESIRHLAFENGQAHCRFQEYSANAPKNQIIRSTLVRLIQTGQFGPNRAKAEDLKYRLRRLVRDLDGIDLVELSPNLIRKQQLGRNDGDYRLMLTICDLLLNRQMPTESVGSKTLPVLDRDTLTLWRVYERFVANFYRLHLRGWAVSSQTPLSWHATESSPHLPSMLPDLILRNESSREIIVLDTKFTANSLISRPLGKAVFDSSHIYQLYAYLRSQEHLSDHHQMASGILLYPTVGYEMSERIVLQGHSIRFETIDLVQEWTGIELHLLTLVSGDAESRL